MLRIEAITRRGTMVRRMLDPDPATGQRRFTSQAFRYTGYQSSDLAYAITGHSAQGATVYTGIALVTGSEARQWLYPAMTRGTDINLVYVFTTPAQAADPRPGTRPAPELGRYDRTRRDRAGYPAPSPFSSQPDQAAQREPVAVLADVLSRDAAEEPASATRQRNLANADHLATLHAIWGAETAVARHDRYRALVTAALPPGHRRPLSTRPAGCTAPCTPPNSPAWIPPTFSAPLSPPAIWPDPATSPPSWTPGSARSSTAGPSAARPLDRTGTRAVRPGQACLPGSGRRDDGRRTRRLGQQTAKIAPAWAVTALGPVPADPAARRDWEHHAAVVAAYREAYGYDHPGDPIGPEPGHQAPEQRAAWYEAFAALRPADGPDVRALPDGRLWLLRDSYATQTAWAPRHTGKDLRLARLAALDASLSAIRADAETAAARKAGDHDRAARHEDLGTSYRTLRDFYQQREQAFAQAMARRQDWEQATAQSRQLAIAADAELRRRRSGQTIEPLRSAEPAPASDAERQHLDLIPHQRNGKTTQIRDPEIQQQAFRTAMNEHHRPTPARTQPAAASARHLSPSGRDGQMRSCSRPNRRSLHQQRSSSSPPSTTSNPKLEANHAPEPWPMRLKGISWLTKASSRCDPGRYRSGRRRRPSPSSR